MDEIKSIIAANIQLLRQRDKLTQAELAEKLNYSDKAVSKWERAESVPDIGTLKKIADLFSVNIDFLISEHTVESIKPLQSAQTHKKNRAFITGICVLLVAFIATLAFVLIKIIPSEPATPYYYLAFIYAVPVAMVVWLIFNSIWFNPKHNFFIISVLVWSIIAAIYLTFLPYGKNFYYLFFLGVPTQLIILLWSRIRKQ